MKFFLTLAVAAATALPAITVHAWGFKGHQAIASAAYSHLSPTARAEVDRLLRVEPEATMASISTWADEHRSPSTSHWHYVNIAADANCHYEPQRDCPDGACVVEAIRRQSEALRTAKSDDAKLKALKYLVHLVADVHQPLHAGRASDKGGNLFQVRAFGRGTNLHALWDSGLFEQDANLLTQWPDVSRDVGLFDPVAWAESSCRIAESDGFRPVGHKVGPGYLDANRAVLTKQMGLAAARLARLLKAVLAGK